MHPDTKPLCNKGWVHFGEMGGLMHAQPSHGTSTFHAGQQTFESEQALHCNDSDEMSKGMMVDYESEPVHVTVQPMLEQVAGVSSNDEGEPPVIELQADDDNKDDIIPWEATPLLHVPAKCRLIATSLTPSLTTSSSSSSHSSSKCQHVSGSLAALYAIND